MKKIKAPKGNDASQNFYIKGTVGNIPCLWEYKDRMLNAKKSMTLC